MIISSNDEHQAPPFPFSVMSDQNVKVRWTIKRDDEKDVTDGDWFPSNYDWNDVRRIIRDGSPSVVEAWLTPQQAMQCVAYHLGKARPGIYNLPKEESDLDADNPGRLTLQLRKQFPNPEHSLERDFDMTMTDDKLSPLQKYAQWLEAVVEHMICMVYGRTG